MGEFLDSAAADSAASIGRPSAVRRSSPAASHFDGGSTADRSSSTRRQSRSPYYQRYQEPPPSPSGARPRSSAVADAYAASVASRAIQPPVVDFRESNGAGATAAAGGGGSLPDRSRQHAAAAALVASIERCSEPIQNGRALQSDIREIRRIIKAYVGRLQDREVTNYVAKEWRIVARVLDRLFFMLYIGTIAVSLATMFPKGEHRIDNVA